MPCAVSDVSNAVGNGESQLRKSRVAATVRPTLVWNVCSGLIGLVFAGVTVAPHTMVPSVPASGWTWAT